MTLVRAAALNLQPSSWATWFREAPRVAGAANLATADELNPAALNRPPTAVESATTGRLLAAVDRRARLEDFACGLLNSKEFLIRS